MDFLPPPLKAR